MVIKYDSLVSFVLLLPRVLKRSVSGARMPSMVPNMVLRPKLSSIRKKSADQKGLPGSEDMASVKAIKARPVPSTPWKQTRVTTLIHYTPYQIFHLTTLEQTNTVKPSAFLFPGHSLLNFLGYSFHTA